MFDMGFWELIVLGVIGLIVLGPERLPTVARTLGRWTGRARSYMRTLSTELEREVNTKDLRRTFEQTRSEIDKTRSEFDQGRRQLESEVRGDDDQASTTSAPVSSTEDPPSQEAATETPADKPVGRRLESQTRDGDS